MYTMSMIAKVLVLIGALNWGFHAYDYNVVEIIDSHLEYDISKVVYLVIASCAIYIILDSRDFMLPFLGETVFPSGLLPEYVPQGADKQIMIKTLPNKKVVYWAAEPGDNSDRDYVDAYDMYANSGTTMSDSHGNANLRIRNPSGYTVPYKYLNPHVHYRTFESSGMLGKIHSVFME
jgi:uncharacterized membrane protein YuzA (DUF378 family)